MPLHTSTLIIACIHLDRLSPTNKSFQVNFINYFLYATNMSVTFHSYKNAQNLLSLFTALILN